MTEAHPIRIRRADEADVDAITALVADAYEKYIERIGRRPKPMTADQHAAVRDHEVWVAEDAADDTLAGTLITEVNAVHGAGFGLGGTSGEAFFTGATAADIAEVETDKATMASVKTMMERNMSSPEPKRMVRSAAQDVIPISSGLC